MGYPTRSEGDGRGLRGAGMSEVRRIVSKWRIVVERESWCRWRWATERMGPRGNFEYERQGRTLTRGGAWEKARGATGLGLLRVEREEALLAREESYVKDEAQPSPIPARLLTDESVIPSTRAHGKRHG